MVDCRCEIETLFDTASRQHPWQALSIYRTVSPHSVPVSFLGNQPGGVLEQSQGSQRQDSQSLRCDWKEDQGSACKNIPMVHLPQSSSLPETSRHSAGQHVEIWEERWKRFLKWYSVCFTSPPNLFSFKVVVVKNYIELNLEFNSSSKMAAVQPNNNVIVMQLWLLRSHVIVMQ